EEEVRYVPGSTAYSVMPYYSYYGNYTGYYSHYTQTVSDPSYYAAEKDYFIQSNLYDAASEEIMWSVQSEVYSPSTLEKFSKSYTAGLLRKLEKDKMLKKWR